MTASTDYGREDIIFRNIPREDKKGGGIGIIYKERYIPSLVRRDRHVTLEFSQWQIKIGTETVSILIVYSPLYSIHTQVSSL